MEILSVDPIDTSDNDANKEGIKLFRDTHGVAYHHYKDGGSNTYQYMEFESPFHLIDSVEKVMEDKSQKQYYDDKSGGGSDIYRWDGTCSWTFGTEFTDHKSTKKAVYMGQPAQRTLDGIEKIRAKFMENETVKKVMEKGQTLKRQRRFNTDGGELDIDRVMCGDPEYWMQMTKGRKNNIVKIAFNYSMNCGNSEEEFYRLAAVASVMSDLLQTCGFSVEIMASTFGYRIDRNHNWTYQGVFMPIKKANEPLDIMKVASIGIPGFFRKYTFGAWVNGLSGKPDSGLGQSREMDDITKKFLDVNYVVGKGYCPNEKKSILYVENIFKQLAEGGDVKIHADTEAV